MAKTHTPLFRTLKGFFVWGCRENVTMPCQSLEVFWAGQNNATQTSVISSSPQDMWRRKLPKMPALFWLRAVISEVYRTASDGNCTVVRAKAHEVPSTGALMLLRKNFAVQQVMTTGTWASQNTFTSFYLRDVTHRLTDTFSIGPVVASQQVL